MPDTPRHRRPAIPGGYPIRVRVQLTKDEHQALQDISNTLAVGIPQVLVEAALGAPTVNPRAALNELAGVRRIITDEAAELHRIAELANSGAWDQDLWEHAARGIQWRNERLTERFAW